MKATSSLSLLFLFLPLVVMGQAATPPTSTTWSQQLTTQLPAKDQVATTSNFTSAKGFVLEDGTPVRLRLNRTISSADAHLGDTVDFEVLEDISVNGTLVIPRVGWPLQR